VEDDVYVLLVTWEPVATNGATFKIYLNPLINWVWSGGVVFIFGTLIAAWPDANEARRRVTSAVAAAPVRTA
jgi:cytochrome c-type biogenesis protein CcmF